MNYVVVLCALRNLKSVGMRTNSFHDLIRFKLFSYQQLIIPSLHLKVSSINHDTIVNVEVSGIFNIEVASFMIDLFEDILVVFVHCSLSV